jgi:hypothetical protein
MQESPSRPLQRATAAFIIGMQKIASLASSKRVEQGFREFFKNDEQSGSHVDAVPGSQRAERPEFEDSH